MSASLQCPLKWVAREALPTFQFISLKVIASIDSKFFARHAFGFPSLFQCSHVMMSDLRRKSPDVFATVFAARIKGERGSGCFVDTETIILLVQGPTLWGIWVGVNGSLLKVSSSDVSSFFHKETMLDCTRKPRAVRADICNGMLLTAKQSSCITKKVLDWNPQGKTPGGS